MKRSTAAVLSVALIVLLAILCSGWLCSGSALAGEQQETQLELREVYVDRNFLSDSWDLHPNRNISKAVVSLSPTAPERYNLDNAKEEVVVFDWKKRQKVLSTDFRAYFSGHPKLGKEECGLKSWELIPNSPLELIDYCDSHFLVDAKNLKVIREVPSDGEGRRRREIRYSRSLGYLIIHWSRWENFELKSSIVRVFNMEDGSLITEWVPEVIDYPVITPDGRFYVTRIEKERRTPRGGKGRTCGVEFRDISSGKIFFNWDMNEKLYFECPAEKAFLPGTDYNFVSLPGMGSHRISFWDARNGTLLRQIKDKRDIGFGGNWRLSANGQWIVGSKRNLPKYVRRQQDFKIWEVGTGKVVYETAKTRRMYPVGTNFIWGNYLEFSHDSRYLLQVKFKELTIYEIIEKP